MREAIFAPYVTTKRRGSSAGGTGLGLAIARRHIEAHGGSIAIETPSGGGALFRVLLPVERRRQP
jgi:signal transduction histidine kinase